MRQLLVATDFTPASRNALEHAARLARALGSEVHLVHVYNEPVALGGAPDGWPAVIVETGQQIRVLMDQERDWLFVNHGLEAAGHIVPGSKGHAVNSLADEINADLVIAGRKKEKDRLFGSTVTKLVRKSDRPVLVIPEGLVYRPPVNMVLAIDFKEMLFRNIFDPVTFMVKRFNSLVRVLHVEKKGSELKASEVAEKLEMGRALAGISYLYEKAEYDDVDLGILDFINRHPADLLVMVSHEHPIFQTLFGSSHAQTISQRINIPLLVLKSS